MTIYISSNPLQTPGVKAILQSKTTEPPATVVLTVTFVETILPTQPVDGMVVYVVGSIIGPLNVSPHVSSIELHNNCAQLHVPVSISEVHDNCAQLKTPEKDAVLGSVVK